MNEPGSVSQAYHSPSRRCWRSASAGSPDKRRWALVGLVVTYAAVAWMAFDFWLLFQYAATGLPVSFPSKQHDWLPRMLGLVSLTFDVLGVGAAVLCLAWGRWRLKLLVLPGAVALSWMLGWMMLQLLG